MQGMHIVKLLFFTSEITTKQKTTITQSRDGFIVKISLFLESFNFLLVLWYSLTAFLTAICVLQNSHRGCSMGQILWYTKKTKRGEFEIPIHNSLPSFPLY